MDTEKILKFALDLLASLGMKLLSSLIVLFIGSRLIKWVKKWIKTSHKLDKVDTGVRTFLSSFLGITLYVILYISIAVILGIPTASFITALASCGVAIGLALQGALGNLAGGIMILIFKPFKIGDYITTAEASGTVSNISIMYTVLTTVDNKQITIPNGTLTNSVIENYSSCKERRVDLVFTTSYDCDIEKVKAILLEAAGKNDKVLKQPEPFARLMNHGVNSLEYTVRVWCKAEDFWDVKFELLEAVKKEFDANGITIPYPQMDIHIDDIKKALK